MTIDNPEVLKRAEAHRAAKKNEYQKSKGQTPMRTVSVTVCKTCRTHVGTFRRDPKSKGLYHVNCPGEKKEVSMMKRIRDIVK